MKASIKQYFPLAAIAAGVWAMRKNKDISGIGALVTRTELNAFLNNNVKRCNKMVNAWWTYLNKQDKLYDYIEDYEKRDEPEVYYSGPYNQRKEEYPRGKWQRAKCSKQLDFNERTHKYYAALCNNLLSGFDVFEGMGGTANDDPRLAKYEEWYQVPRELVEELYTNGSFYNVKCILVTYNGIPQFVVDPQGFNYARYVGILDTFNTIV